MKVNSNNVNHESSPKMIVAKQSLEAGSPLITMVDETVGPDMVKAQLIIPAFGTPAGTRITLKQSIAAGDFRSLSSAIKGGEYAAPLRKGDILCFNQVYTEQYEGNVIGMVGQVTARTNDKLRGDVQILTAMASPSKASVKAHGAHQTLTILDTSKAMSVGTPEHVRQAWKIVKDIKAIGGGDAGFLIRDAAGASAGDWFEKKGEDVEVLLSAIDQQDAFEGGALLELIPAWKLKMSRDQMSLDVDLRYETKQRVIGAFSRMFDYGDNRGTLGFKTCAIVVADEPETGFNNSFTGNIIRSIVGVQPFNHKKAAAVAGMPTNLRKYNGEPVNISRFYSDEQLATMKKERVERRGPDAPITKSSGSNPSRGSGYAEANDDDEDTGYTAKPAIKMGRR